MLTVASWITLSRIFLTPVVIWLLLEQSWMAAVIIFLVAAATDLIDGFVARRYDQQSRLGQLLDPIADKTLLMGTLFTLLKLVAVSPWHRVVVIFLLMKEAVLLIGGAILIGRYNYFIKPSRLSRLTSLIEVVLVVTILGCLISCGYVQPELISLLLMVNLLFSVWLLTRYVMHLYFMNIKVEQD
jgi:cardiolipin synthase (CMP-forming)